MPSRVNDTFRTRNTGRNMVVIRAPDIQVGDDMRFRNEEKFGQLVVEVEM